VASVTLWAPRIEISSYPGDDGPNVSRLLRAAGEPADSTAPAEQVQLGRVVIHDGLLEVLSPSSSPSPSRIPTVPVPGGEGRLRRLALEGIQGNWEDVVLHPGEGTLLTSMLRSLAVDVSVLDEPIRITDGRGRFTYGRDGIRLEDGEVSLTGSDLTGSLRVGPGRPAKGHRSRPMKAETETVGLRARGPAGRALIAIARHLPPFLRRRVAHLFWRLGWLEN